MRTTLRPIPRKFMRLSNASPEEAGLVFIGPDAEAIESMGNKLEAHAIAKRVGVPLIPSSGGAVSDADKQKSRSSWTWFDVAGSAAVLGAILAAYLFFVG